MSLSTSPALADHRIHVAQSRFKFSCAHMTVFPDGTKERLHGHNFTIAVACELSGISLPELVDFRPIKQALLDLCQSWKERLLLAEASPHFEIKKQDNEELEFLLCNQRYVLPRQDALLLPIDNVSVEALAALAGAQLLERLEPTLRGSAVTAMEVTVEETPGQGATFRWRAGSAENAKALGPPEGSHPNSTKV